MCPWCGYVGPFNIVDDMQQGWATLMCLDCGKIFRVEDLEDWDT
jgi:hypothetical protein